MTNKINSLWAISVWHYYAMFYNCVSLPVATFGGTEEKIVPDCFEAFPLHIRQHFLEKWNALYESYGCRAVLAAFFNELSDTYRIPLMEWVLEHYGKFVDKSRFGEEE